MSLTKVKINKEFFIKYKIVLMCILCTIFALLTPYWSGFCYFTYAGLLLSGLLFTMQEALQIYGYLFFFTGLTLQWSGAYVMWSIVLLGILIQYVYRAIRKEVKVAKNALIMSAIFYVFSIIPLWNYAHVFGIGLALLFLGPIYLFYIHRDELDVLKILKSMFWGLVASFILSLIFVELFAIYPYTQLTYLGDRWQGFTDNPNTISFASILIMTSFVVAILKNREEWWFALLYISITIGIGSRCGSKSFLLASILLVIATTFIIFLKNKKRGLIVGGIVLLVGVGVFFSFRSYFQFIIERFVIEGSLSIGSITTDRWTVWQVFIKTQFSSAINVIFGMGAWTEIFLPFNENTMKGCHSIFLEFFYYFGIVGVINLILLMIAYSKDTQIEKGGVKIFVKLEDILPLLMVFLLGCGEMVIFNRKGVFLHLALLFIYNHAKYIPKDSRKLERLNVFKKNKRRIKHE